MSLDRDGGKTGSQLPPELARLDRRLRGIAIEERSSFGAELRAALAEEHRRAGDQRERMRMKCVPSLRVWSGPRLTVAAVAGVLLLGAASLAALSVRTPLAELLGRSRTSESSVGLGSGQVESGSRPEVALDEPSDVSGMGEASPLPPRPAEVAVPDAPSAAPAVPPVHPLATLPGLLNPDDAREVVAARYPAFLREAGIGGTVRVLAWVEADGTAEHVQVSESSGVAALDRAALGAAGDFRFRPATRGLRAVGTWVEFSIRFRPSARAEDQPDPEYQAPRIPLGY